MKGDHARFKPAILVFALFVLLQFGTGVLLYVNKIGLHPADTLEYYVGSEAMLKVYPGRPDRFKQPRTFMGLAKFAMAHFAAFGIICFILAHLLRSLGKAVDKLPLADGISLALFALALLDVLSGFLVRYGPPWTAHARIGVFALFTLLGVLASAMLAAMVFRAPSNPADGR